MKSSNGIYRVSRRTRSGGWGQKKWTIPGLMGWLLVALLFANGKALAQDGRSKDTAIELGRLNDLVTGSLNVNQQQPNAWFRFEVGPGVRSVTPSITGGSGSVVVNLRKQGIGAGENDRLVRVNISASNGKLPTLWLNPGIYFVQVEWYDATAFQLNLASLAQDSPGDGDDERASATNLGSTPAIGTWYDWVGVSDNEDWYKFNITESVHAVTVGVSDGVLGTSVTVTLMQFPNGPSPVVFESKTISSVGGTLQSQWLDPGTYYVRVRYYDNAAYRIQVKATPKASLGLLDNERDFANDLGTAPALKVVKDWVGIADPEDWYQFEIADGVRAVTVGLEGGKAGSASVYLRYSPTGADDGRIISEGTIPVTGGSIRAEWLDPGTYYIQVRYYDNAEYSLIVTTEPRDSRGLGDNTRATATDLGLVSDPKPVQDWLGFFDTEDWFKFEVTGVERDVSIGFGSGSSTLTGTLWKFDGGNGTQIVRATVSASGGALPTKKLAPGIYYLQLEFYNPTVYRLRVVGTLPPNTPPLLTVPPVGTTINEGRALTLKVLAEGSGLLRYQWFQNGKLLEGRTTRELYIETASPQNSGEYTVKVSSQYGETTSKPVTVEVVPAGFEVVINDAVLLSWPASFGPDAILEGTNDIDDVQSWRTVSTQSLLAGDRREFGIRKSERTTFYRLRKP